MLIQNINANVLKKNEKETSHDKGWGIMEQGAIALVVIIVLALVLVDCICCVHEPVWQMKVRTYRQSSQVLRAAAKR